MAVIPKVDLFMPLLASGPLVPSRRPLCTRYCHLRSSASAISSDWHSTGSTRPDCNWTTKFRSQRPATWNRLPTALRSLDLSESAPSSGHLRRTCSRPPVPLRFFLILAPHINIQTYLLTFQFTLKSVQSFSKYRAYKFCSI